MVHKLQGYAKDYTCPKCNNSQDINFICTKEDGDDTLVDMNCPACGITFTLVYHRILHSIEIEETDQILFPE